MPFCGGEKMTPAWAQRQADLLRDCIVSPDVFASMVDRLCDFVVPYQHALETEAGKRHVHLYLAGLLSHLDRKNAEKIAALVDVERLVIRDRLRDPNWRFTLCTARSMPSNNAKRLLSCCFVVAEYL
jgi:hypothetical protein